MGERTETLDAGARRIADLHQGVHACLVYEDSDDPVGMVAPYIAAGLAAGERCIYVLGEHDADEVRCRLAEAEIAVAAAESSGALVLVSRWDVSFPDGEFDPAAMIEYVRTTIRATTAAGFAGVRLVAEMTWALAMGVGHDKLVHYEAIGNHLYPDEPLVAVCMYNRSRFPDAVCQDALRTHPVVAVGDELHANLYYEWPEAVIGCADAASKLDWMIEQLQRARQAEEQRTQLAEARAALQARDEFISIAAHELRTPMTSLRGYAQLLARRLRQQTGDLDGIRHVAEILDREATKLNDMVGQLLDTTRIQAGKLALSPRPTDLVTIVHLAVARARTAAETHDLVVTGPEQLAIIVDPLRFEQVLTNLLDNAVKFSPLGSQIDVEIGTPKDDIVEIAVRDRGPGIAPEHRDHIFDRYHQVASGQGMGLGLAISRDIAHLHGGEVRLESPPDGGARFVVSLPAMAVRPLDATPPMAAEPI